MSLALEGAGLKEGTELTVSITMRRLGQNKTAWPAEKTTLLQAGATTSQPSIRAQYEVQYKRHNFTLTKIYG